MTEETKFEKALERLEKIVEDLEAGNLALEDALKKYEEGVKLSRMCQERLTQAEKRIEVLSRNLDGTFKKEPFEGDEGAAENGSGETASAKKSRRTAAEKGITEDEDLLL